MKLFFLLVLLSRNGAGDINASFVNTDTLEQCLQKEQLLKGIFSSANIPVVESRCIESHLRFSKFDHLESSNSSRYFYVIRFVRERIRIREMPDWKSCMRAQKAGGGEHRLYCSSSIQWIEEP